MRFARDEAKFGNLKTKGSNLEDTHLTNTDKLSTLLAGQIFLASEEGFRREKRVIREAPGEPSKGRTNRADRAGRGTSCRDRGSKTRVAKLERRLELNSSNSPKPRSRDRLKKLARVSLRERSSKKAGGQKMSKSESDITATAA